MPLVITTLEERPELTDRLYDLADAWPEFMLHDPVGTTLFHQVAPTVPAYSIVATLGGDLVARGRAVPFAFPTDVMLDALRDAVRRQGHDTLYAPVRPNGKTDPSQPMTSNVQQYRSDGMHVPGALAPVRADVAQNHAVYVEPNVWVRHDLGQGTAP